MDCVELRRVCTELGFQDTVMQLADDKFTTGDRPNNPYLRFFTEFDRFLGRLYHSG